MTPLVFTEDQLNAESMFNSFIMDPVERVLVIAGYSGTGKSTLVKRLIEQLPIMLRTVKLINPDVIDYEVELTATTNKAAEALMDATGGYPVRTIYSLLGLRVHKDYTTQRTELMPKNNDIVSRKIIFIDEASFLDKKALAWIFKLTKNCKIIFVGDPAQLTQAMSTETPVFNAGFTTAYLTQVVRQAEGNPIIDLSTKFREAVTTGEFFSFKPDGVVIQHMDRKDFNQRVLNEFTRPDWKYTDSKVLGWTNKCATDYNAYVNEAKTGDPEFRKGDYAVNNKFITLGGKSIKTDELVHITQVSDPDSQHGVAGKHYTINNTVTAFCPDSLTDKRKLISQCNSNARYEVLEHIDTKWIDLRALFACTIDKSQGSTYGSVYVDLDDVSRCNSGNRIARMLYVGISRARSNVYLTGDFV